MQRIGAVALAVWVIAAALGVMGHHEPPPFLYQGVRAPSHCRQAPDGKGCFADDFFDAMGRVAARHARSARALSCASTELSIEDFWRLSCPDPALSNELVCLIHGGGFGKPERVKKYCRPVQRRGQRQQDKKPRADECVLSLPSPLSQYSKQLCSLLERKA